jgi:acyl dehydratase
MRIAHGMLRLSVVTGLMMRSGIAESTATGLLDVEWKFIAPVKEGDTIRVRFEIVEKNETRKHDRGIVRYQVQMVNQNNETVGEGFLSNLYFKRV